MGVKSTVTLSRKEATDRLIDIRIIRYRRRLEAEYSLLSDEWLENALESANDYMHGGEGFENYLIRD